mmetsp:Transcript_13377/g.16643  ORF Transcript_13377/g.16643 Transcript_13377/m.16643 type:complete len:107 (+) Transcript_13377:348-668(+)
MLWAKLSRQTNKLEAELESKRMSRQASLQTPWKKTLSSILSTRLLVLLACVYLIPTADRPLMVVSYEWTWPLSKPLSLPSFEAGCLSSLGWALVCQRVCTRAFSVL